MSTVIKCEIGGQRFIFKADEDSVFIEKLDGRDSVGKLLLYQNQLEGLINILQNVKFELDRNQFKKELSENDHSK